MPTDIVYTKSTSEKPTDPASYHAMFERGIDPGELLLVATLDS